jgi:methylphosphotriester-DNA--protein-cysteine methyltransferase
MELSPLQQNLRLQTQPRHPKSQSPSDPWLARSDSARYAILAARSCRPSAVPPFIYGVKSTKIYCRPTCPARLARRANVVFFDTALEAKNVGYRACKRCRPDVVADADVEDAKAETSEDPSKTITAADYVAPGDGESGRKKVIKAVEIIKEHAARGERISLADLGKEVDLSKWHLLRVFRKRWGVSPREMGEGAIRGASLSDGAQETKMHDPSGPMFGEDEVHGNPSDTMGEDSVSLIDAYSTSNTNTSSSTPLTNPLLDWSDGDFAGPLLTFDEAFMDFQAMGDMDMDRRIVSESWTGEESGEYVLRDLFPELYMPDDADLEGSGSYRAC